VTEKESSYPARWWHRIDNDRIQCDLCPLDCKLHEGQRGVCFVRKMENNQLVLSTYGRSGNFTIEPIEKKPLKHFIPGSSVLTFSTVGCNLSCKFCQNWVVTDAVKIDSSTAISSPKEIAQFAKQQTCQSIAFAYNDPIIFAEYAMDIADECRLLGIKSVAITNGYMHEIPRREFYAKIDAANIDLKAFTDEFYVKITGSHLRPVLDTLTHVKHETNVWLEITNMLITGKNDSNDEIKAMTRWIVRELGDDVPVFFSAFFPNFKMINDPVTPITTLKRAQQIAWDEGIKYAYTSNVDDVEGGSTRCFNCKSIVIKRNYYSIEEYHLDAKGCCNHCGHQIPGVFEKFSGQLGRRRSPIPVHDITPRYEKIKYQR